MINLLFHKTSFSYLLLLFIQNGTKPGGASNSSSVDCFDVFAISVIGLVNKKLQQMHRFRVTNTESRHDGLVQGAHHFQLTDSNFTLSWLEGVFPSVKVMLLK